jgi:hypothetical protein
VSTQVDREFSIRAKPHLDQAQLQVQELIDRGCPQISELFQKARANVPEFSQTCLGWSSKWRLAADAVPFSRGDRHSDYIREQFETQLFRADELERAIKQTIAEFLTEVRSIESHMLVALRADLADFPESDPVQSLDREQLEVKFQEAIQSAAGTVGDDLQSNVNSQLVSLIAGEVLAQVAVRLGVSAGILGTGAASGWVTLGVGVVIGLVIDQIVMWIWDWWYDPNVELAKQLQSKLLLLEQLICRGDGQSPGLEGKFRELAKSRDLARRAAIESLFHSSGQR